MGKKTEYLYFFNFRRFLPKNLQIFVNFYIFVLIENVSKHAAWKSVSRFYIENIFKHRDTEILYGVHRVIIRKHFRSIFFCNRF